MTNIKTEPLRTISLPLHGRHLIEASAGTGKTYNITRIYVRLLLEKKLNVKQILVMTFTEAATEEIRERIALFIHELLLNWHTQPCEFSLAMQDKVGSETGKALLEIAALELDLASIYTIHGFCQRVIMRFGLSMTIAQQASLKTDFSHIQFTCVCDALLRLRKNKEDFLLLQNRNWHDPHRFISEFASLLAQDSSRDISDKHAIISAQVALFEACWQEHSDLRHSLLEQFSSSEDILLSGLKVTPANMKKISLEIEEAKQWLAQSHFLPENEAPDIIEEWMQGTVKNDELLCKPFKTLVSKTRLKNILAAHNVDESHPLFVNANILLDDIANAGLNTDHKKALLRALEQSATFAVVNNVIKEINLSIASYKITHRVIGFDDLITSVAQSLNSSNPFLRETLQAEYPAALVDEFQDTDLQQYEIFSALFPNTKQDGEDVSRNVEDELESSAKRMLVMIGDPKQAIYSFRGGDIFTYLRAKNEANYKWSMSTNYRSSAQVIQAYNRVFYGAAPDPIAASDEPSPLNLFDYKIDYTFVMAPPPSSKTMAITDPQQVTQNYAIEFVYPFAQRLKQVSASGRNETKETPINQQNKDLLNWCALEIKRLLSSVHIEQESASRLVMPEDIAILVRSGKQAKLVKQVFDSHHLPSVFLSEKSPLFATRQALNLYWLLQAIHQPSKTHVRRAISTHLLFVESPQTNNMQQTITLLQDDDHPHWERIFAYLQKLALLWKSKGIYTLITELMQHQHFQHEEAERQLTNYLHLADELAQASICHPTALQLIYWLHIQITEPEAQEASQLRLESDQKLIKVVTQHKSKGLEYPIVFLPFANQVSKFPQGNVISYHDHNKDARIQLGWSPIAVNEYKREQAAEDMRLLYVSLTRPILRTYIGMAGRVDFNSSAIMRALNVRLDKTQEYENMGEYLANEVSQKLTDISDLIKHTQTLDKPVISNVEVATPNSVQTVLEFNARIDSTWQLSSFSKMVNVFSTAQHIQSNINDTNNISFERAQEVLEPSLSDTEQTTHSSSENIAIPYAFSFPKGPDAGNYLHDLLEHLDFQTSDVAYAVANSELNISGSYYLAGQYVEFEPLSSWLDDVLKAPMLPQDNLSLASMPLDKTLRESEFYFTVKQTNLQEIANVVNEYRHYLADKFNFPLSGNQLLKISNTQHQDVIKGALHGYIDLIFESDNRYYVADYKSNHLGLEYSAYTPSYLAQDIIKHNYDLQFLIYSLALHRYLQNKLTDYQYSSHFGGVYYLFLRGMRKAIDENDKGSGVFYDELPEHFIHALDQIFAGQEEIL